MASCRELSKLTTNMNTIPSSVRPSRNSQGIHNMSQHPMRYAALQSDQQGTPIIPCFLKVYLPSMVQPRNPFQPTRHLPRDRLKASCHASGRMTGLLTHQVNLSNQVLSLSVTPFIVSNNGKIYNFTGGSFKQLYAADPSEHKFLVSLANSPNTFSSIISSVLNLFPRFSGKQTNSGKNQV